MIISPPRPIFLTAEWRKLIVANYEIDPALLVRYLPRGVELDSYRGKHWISLVGFLFLNTKVLGMGIPFHKNFEEFNLRFYVRYRSDEGWFYGGVYPGTILGIQSLYEFYNYGISGGTSHMEDLRCNRSLY